jgi:hypothetical protein
MGSLEDRLSFVYVLRSQRLLRESSDRDTTYLFNAIGVIYPYNPVLNDQFDQCFEFLPCLVTLFEDGSSEYIRMDP